MISRRTIFTPLLVGLISLFAIACGGNAVPTPPPQDTRPAPTSTVNPDRSAPSINTPTPVNIESKIRENLLLYVPGTNECTTDVQHVRVIDAAVSQVRDDIYNNGLVRGESTPLSSLAVDEKTAWEYISRAVGFVVPQLCRIDVSGYTDMDLRQILMPRELRLFSINKMPPRNQDGTVDDNILAIGLHNVSYIPDLGKSLQELLRDDVLRDYHNKDSLGYRNAMRLVLNRPGWEGCGGWSDNYEKWKELVQTRLSTGEDLPFFIIGWVNSRFGEAEIDAYGPLVGRVFNSPIVTYGIRANYPSGTATHTELAVKIDGDLIHFWNDEDSFNRAYNCGVSPSISLLGPDGREYSPFTLQPKP